MTAWLHELFFIDHLPYPFSLPIKLNSILFHFFPGQPSLGLHLRKYQRTELGLGSCAEFVVSQECSLRFILQRFGLMTGYSTTIPACLKAFCCVTSWVSHNLSVFSFLKRGDKAARFFILYLLEEFCEG